MLDLHAHLLALENLANDVRNEITAQETAAKVASEPVVAPLTTEDTLESRLAALAEAEAEAPVTTEANPADVTVSSAPPIFTEPATIQTPSGTKIDAKTYWDMAVKMNLVTQEYADQQLANL